MPSCADWIRNNIEPIAQAIVRSLTEYFGIPFNQPQPIFVTNVMTRGSALNVRYTPSLSGTVIGRIPNGGEVTVYAQLPDWSLVSYNGLTGYVSSRYLQ